MEKQTARFARPLRAPRRPGVDYAVVSSPEQAWRTVAAWADRGFETVKVRCPIQVEVLAAVIDAAHARGLTVTGRLGSATRRAVRAAGATRSA